jgi:hypothetical protein
MAIDPPLTVDAIPTVTDAAPTEEIPAADAAVGAFDGPQFAVSMPSGETGYWYCLGTRQDHGGLGALDKSRIFQFQNDRNNPVCPTCPVCQKQQACWVAVGPDVFPEGALRLV